jgi:uroporphyrinogen-III synthase
VSKNIQILYTGQAIEKGIEENIPKNLAIDTIPFIETALSTDLNTLEELHNLERENAFIVVTSQISVSWLKKNIKSVPNWSIACMKGQTQKALVELGWEALIQYTDTNSLEIAKKIALNTPKSTTINFVGSNQRLANLPDYLKKEGYQVKELIAYTTTEKYQEIEKQYDAIIFLSPSAVNSFFEHYSIGEQVTLFAIGQTTADAVSKKTRNKIIISNGNSQLELFNTIINHYQSL